MKLKELTGYKQDPYYQKAVEIFKNYTITTSKKIDEFAYFMKDNGFNILGSGISGLAFEKNGYPWVFKIIHDDEGYIHYFNYAKKNQHNPNVPKIKGGVMKLTSDSYSGTLYLVRIEKLQHMPNSYNRNDLIQLITGIEFSDDLTPDIEQKIAKVYPGIVDIIKDSINSGFSLDIRFDNIMLRGNTLVITDPLVG